MQARSTLMDFAELLHDVSRRPKPHPDVVAALSDDLNTPSALSIIHGSGQVGAARNAGSRGAA